MEVKLSEILEALEFMNSDNAACLNIKNGEVILLSESDISAAQGDSGIENHPEWQQENIAVAQRIFLEDSKNYITLPGNFEIDEYDMMQRFIRTIPDNNIIQTLSTSIKGSGAFRRFKEHLYQFGIQEKWFTYRANEYKQLAIQWCDENNIEYTDG